MTTIKVHYRRVELTHDGYCSETGEDDLIEKNYDSDDESIIRTELYSADIPEEQFNSDGTLKSKYWYNYVYWKKNEVMEDMSAGHCCCPPIGIIFKIYKVEKEPQDDNKDDDIESDDGLVPDGNGNMVYRESLDPNVPTDLVPICLSEEEDDPNDIWG